MSAINNTRVLRFVTWPDNRFSILKRTYSRNYDTKEVTLDAGIDTDTYTQEETALLHKTLNEMFE